MKLYAHKTCNSCKKAQKWLDQHQIEAELIAIADNPPSVAELNQAIDAGYTLKALFNTSGQEYRARDMKNALPKMSQEEALTLLSQTGMLVKRPFLVVDDGNVLVGFKEEAWKAALA